MLISDFFINKILNKIRSLNYYDDEDVDVIRYSLQAILWECEKAIILFIVFTLMGRHVDFLVTLIALISIRLIAGGYHSQTALRCLLFTFIMFFMAIVILPQIPLNDMEIFTISGFTMFVTLLAAPIRSIEKEAIQDKTKDIHKKIAVCIITLVWLTGAYIHKMHTYSQLIVWIIFLQNVQLLFEYFKRRRGE